MWLLLGLWCCYCECGLFGVVVLFGCCLLVVVFGCGVYKCTVVMLLGCMLYGVAVLSGYLLLLCLVV